MPCVRRTRVAALLAIALVLLSACSTSNPAPSSSTTSAPATAGEYSDLVSADDFARTVTQRNRVTINVHVPFEGAIRGTDQFIPFDRIEQQAARLPSDRSAPLAIYCRTGSMSATAAKTLAALGYTDVVELQGGMQAWEASGRSLTTDLP